MPELESSQTLQQSGDQTPAAGDGRDVWDDIVDVVDGAEDDDKQGAEGDAGQQQAQADPEVDGGDNQGLEGDDDLRGEEGQTGEGSGDDPTQQQQQSPQDGKLTAPEHWAQADKEAFNALPREGQELFLKRHREMEGYLTRRSQEIAEKEKALSGLQGLAVHLQDPNFRQYLHNYFAQQSPQEMQQPPQGMQQGEDIPPDDPFDRIKWEQAKELRAELDRRDQALAQQIGGIALQERINQVRMTVMSDPLYAEVKESLVDFVKDLPAHLQEPIYQRLDQDPDFFYQTYLDRRKIVEAKKQQRGQQGGGNPVLSSRVANRQQQKPPLLEQSGAAQDQQAGKADELKKLRRSKARAAASGSTDALADFLDDAGLIEKLVG